jgi:ParB family transcriptional regulator, chromosome partitioning protein
MREPIRPGVVSPPTLKEIAMPQLLSKPLPWFKPDPGQPRKTFNEPELRALGESMKAHGQLQPVVATSDGLLRCGQRRLMAAGLTGIPELTVIISDKPLSDSEVKIIQLVENMHRADLSGWDKYVGCAEWMSMNPSAQLKDLAEALKLEPSMVTRLMSPSKCIPAWLEALKMGKVGISDCYAASRLPESEQSGLLAMKLSGASRDALEAVGRRKRS